MPVLPALASAEIAPSLEPEPFGAFRDTDAGLFVRNDHARMLRHVADNGLAAVAHRHVLHGDGGLASGSGSGLSASIWAGNVRASLPKARAALSC
jgi:hypothetical protein